MDIQVGDRVKYKVKRTGNMYIEIVDSKERAEDLENGTYYEILKIERPKYEVIKNEINKVTEHHITIQTDKLKELILENHIHYDTLKLKDAIEYLMLMKDKIDFNKIGFVYGTDSIDTVLRYIENSISKENIKKEIKKLEEKIDNLHGASDCVLIDDYENIIEAYRKLLNMKVEDK